jgi:hypothetical protein
MRWPGYQAQSAPALMLAIALLTPPLPSFVSPAVPGGNKPKNKTPRVRWDEQTPGCTFSRSADGRLSYGMWSGDVGITVSVDSQELEKAHRRHQPFFAVLLAVRYRGPGVLEFHTDNISMEFAKHSQVLQTALDPDTFAQKIQNEADAVDHAAAREVQRHPERKQEKEALARAFQKDAAELLEFVSKSSLRPARLGPGNPETHGWVLFGLNRKWIGEWKKQEQSVLRVPVGETVFEFPFELPPKPGEEMLRRRE